MIQAEQTWMIEHIYIAAFVVNKKWKLKYPRKHRHVTVERKKMVTESK
jgi:hypothetical protein